MAWYSPGWLRELFIGKREEPDDGPVYCFTCGRDLSGYGCGIYSRSLGVATCPAVKSECATIVSKKSFFPGARFESKNINELRKMLGKGIIEPYMGPDDPGSRVGWNVPLDLPGG